VQGDHDLLDFGQVVLRGVFGQPRQDRVESGEHVSDALAHPLGAQLLPGLHAPQHGLRLDDVVSRNWL